MPCTSPVPGKTKSFSTTSSPGTTTRDEYTTVLKLIFRNIRIDLPTGAPKQDDRFVFRYNAETCLANPSKNFQFSHFFQNVYYASQDRKASYNFVGDIVSNEKFKVTKTNCLRRTQNEKVFAVIVNTLSLTPS